MEILGIDIGSYGVKGAIVDTDTGKFVSEKFVSDTMPEITPAASLSNLHKLIKHFKWDGPIGCAFPAAIKYGVVASMDRVHENWLKLNVENFFEEIVENTVFVVNDADAAGIAEIKYGAAKDQSKGLVLMLTVGTGIGSSLFIDGNLIPNTDLGHIEIKGEWAEEKASNKARKEEGLKKKAWAKRLQKMLLTFEDIFHPELFILGGQLSTKSEKTFPFIKIDTPFVAATYQNDASIIGSAIYASERIKKQKG